MEMTPEQYLRIQKNLWAGIVDDAIVKLFAQWLETVKPDDFKEKHGT